MNMLELWFSATGGWSWFPVLFTGTFDQIDASAARYVKTHGHLVMDEAAFEALVDDGNVEVGPLLADALYPSCEHGMLARLCAGPQHYPMDV